MAATTVTLFGSRPNPLSVLDSRPMPMVGMPGRTLYRDDGVRPASMMGKPIFYTAGRNHEPKTNTPVTANLCSLRTAVQDYTTIPQLTSILPGDLLFNHIPDPSGKLRMYVPQPFGGSGNGAYLTLPAVNYLLRNDTRLRQTMSPHDILREFNFIGAALAVDEENNCEKKPHELPRINLSASMKGPVNVPNIWDIRPHRNCPVGLTLVRFETKQDWEVMLPEEVESFKQPDKGLSKDNTTLRSTQKTPPPVTEASMLAKLNAKDVDISQGSVNVQELLKPERFRQASELAQSNKEFRESFRADPREDSVQSNLLLEKFWNMWSWAFDIKAVKAYDGATLLTVLETQIERIKQALEPASDLSPKLLTISADQATYLLKYIEYQYAVQELANCRLFYDPTELINYPVRSRIAAQHFEKCDKELASASSPENSSNEWKKWLADEKTRHQTSSDFWKLRAAEITQARVSGLLKRYSPQALEEFKKAQTVESSASSKVAASGIVITPSGSKSVGTPAQDDLLPSPPLSRTSSSTVSAPASAAGSASSVEQQDDAASDADDAGPNDDDDDDAAKPDEKTPDKDEVELPPTKKPRPNNKTKANAQVQVPAATATKKQQTPSAAAAPATTTRASVAFGTAARGSNPQLAAIPEKTTPRTSVAFGTAVPKKPTVALREPRKSDSTVFSRMLKMQGETIPTNGFWQFTPVIFYPSLKSSDAKQSPNAYGDKDALSIRLGYLETSSTPIKDETRRVQTAFVHPNAPDWPQTAKGLPRARLHLGS